MIESQENTEQNKQDQVITVDTNRSTLERIRRRLLITLLIRVIVCVGELVVGVIAGSIAIVADSSEKFSDMVYISVSAYSVHLVMKRANKQYSYGYLRAGVIGALLSSIIMWIIAAVIVYEGVQKIINIDSEEVNGKLMFYAALAGIIVNFFIIAMLQQQPAEEVILPQDDIKENDESNRIDDEKKKLASSKNENLRTVMADIIGDMVQSILTIIASILIWSEPQRLKLADPICSFFFPVITFFVTKNIILDNIRVLMEASPEDMDVDQIQQRLGEIVGVKAVHDVHVWQLSAGRLSASVHLRTESQTKEILKEAIKTFKQFGIQHSNIQIENDDLSQSTDFDCSHIH